MLAWLILLTWRFVLHVFSCSFGRHVKWSRSMDCHLVISNVSICCAGIDFVNSQKKKVHNMVKPQLHIERQSHAFSSVTHENSRKIVQKSEGRDKYIFDHFWIVPWITHMMCNNLKVILVKPLAADSVAYSNAVGKKRATKSLCLLFFRFSNQHHNSMTVYIQLTACNTLSHTLLSLVTPQPVPLQTTPGRNQYSFKARGHKKIWMHKLNDNKCHIWIAK